MGTRADLHRDSHPEPVAEATHGVPAKKPPGPGANAAVHRIANETCFTDVNNFKGPITATPVCTTDVAAYLQAERPAMTGTSSARPVAARPVDRTSVNGLKATLRDMRLAPKVNRPQWAENLRQDVARVTASLHGQPVEVEGSVYAELDKYFMQNTADPGEDIEAWNVLTAWRDRLLERARMEAGTQARYVALEQQIADVTRRMNAAGDTVEGNRLAIELDRLHAEVRPLRGNWIMPGSG